MSSLCRSREASPNGLAKKREKLLKRRQAIEPIIGHLKADHRMNRCHLKGAEGDAIHAVLCAAGYNVRWLLRMIRKKGIRLYLTPDKTAGFGWFAGEKHANKPNRTLQTRSPNRITFVKMNFSRTNKSDGMDVSTYREI